MLSSWDIGRKLLVVVGGSIAVILGLFGLYAVSTRGDLTRELVISRATQVVQLRADEIEQFLVARGKVAQTLQQSPTVLRHLAEHNRKGPPRATQDYRDMVSFFSAVVAADPVVDEAFAADTTGDYFRAAGPVTQEGYDATQRPWWKEALRVDELYVASPTASATDGSISVVLQGTVYAPTGELLGVTGVDVMIDAVRELVEAIRYEDQGTAFLVDREGLVIAFAGAELPVKAPLSSVDIEVEGADGFAELVGAIDQPTSKLPRVRWQDQDYLVLLTPVTADSPVLHWTLGLMVPEGIIVEPIRSARWFTAAAILLAIAIVAAVTLTMTGVLVTRPIRRLADRFRDISEGRGDLTRRVEVTSSDEIGELGTTFNAFVGSIQEDVRSIGAQANALTGASTNLHDLSQQMASTTEETSAQANLVSSAAEQVSTNVQTVAAATAEMDASIREIARNANEAAQVATEAVHLADQTTATFSHLDESSTTIGNVIKVIHGIAEQTNLLALNATIEAARAGEAGKGFAVVAGEVKSLASQTAAATEEISQTVQSIQGRTREAGEAIGRISNIINRINEIQATIAAAVEEQTATTSEIARSVGEAATGTGEIAQSVAGIAEAAQSSAQGAGAVQQAATELAHITHELERIVERFSY